MRRAVLDRLLAERAAKRPTALVTDLDSGAQAILAADGVFGDLALSPEVLAAARAALRADRSGPLAFAGRRLFLQAHNPPLRLAIVGAVHIAQALAPMAALARYEVTVIDPRRAFATDRRFPDVALSTEWPDEAMARMALDARTAVVTLTHDPKLDDPALQAALRAPVFYIGALGSRKTHAARLKRLAEAGFPEAETARIHGPIGLPLGGRAPAEIAIAILAEMVATLHGADRPAAAEQAA